MSFGLILYRLFYGVLYGDAPSNHACDLCFLCSPCGDHHDDDVCGDVLYNAFLHLRGSSKKKIYKNVYKR